MPAPDPIPSVPFEKFRALEEIPGCRHGFLGCVPGIDVQMDRATALARLDGCHRQVRQTLGVGERAFVTAEQVHGNAVAVISAEDLLPASPILGVDGLITNRTDVCLGIYVADCCAVFLVDPRRRVIGLVHSGRKGSESGITTVAIETMRERFGCQTSDLVVQLSPCIRPPWYEVDFAAQIVAQCGAADVGRVEDGGTCTAANPARYYSYRREKGQTGRMLALLALT